MSAAERESLKAEITALIDRLADGSRDEPARQALLARTVGFQEQAIPTYARLLATRRRLDPRAIAAMPTDVFRFTRIAAHEAAQDVRVFRTSGTTQGERGTHAFRDLALYDHAARAEAKRMLFPDLARMRLVLVAPSSAEAQDSSLSYMLDRFVDWFGASVVRGFREGALDVEAIVNGLREAEQTGESVAVLGTSFAFVHLDDALGPTRFSLPAGSRIMQTGGFKGRSRSIEPNEMRAMLATRYGVPESHVVAEYGMTELSSQMYETTLRDALAGRTGGGRHFAVPGWMRVVPVDPDTLLPVAPGMQGLLRLEDLANLDSCAVLQTADLGRLVDDGFVLLGRAPGAVPRGCSLAVDEALGGRR